MKRPNFLVIGAAKSGTTALCDYFGQHPQIFLCHPKEPHFFAFEGETLNFQGPDDEFVMNRRAVTRWDDYLKLFQNAGDARALGDGSVSTLYYPNAIPRIQQHMPNGKLICILREPAERAYSAFMYMVSLVRETESDFRKALDLEPQRIAANWHHIWHYRRMGMYHEQLSKYFAAFSREQLLVLLYDDFRANPGQVLRTCYEFLDVDPNFQAPREPDSLRSGVPKHPRLQRMITSPGSIKNLLKSVLPTGLLRWIRESIVSRNLQRARMAPDVKSELREYYREEVLRLQDLLQRDLSAWLPTNPDSKPKHATREQTTV